MKEKILLIDGHSILNRAYYGLPELTNSEGLHTNAIYGFLNILFKMLEEENPDYLTVAFDLSAPTFRHKMYDAYKGTRKPMPGELREQVPVIICFNKACERYDAHSGLSEGPALGFANSADCFDYNTAHYGPFGSHNNGIFYDGHSGNSTYTCMVDGSVQNYKTYEIIGYFNYDTDYLAAKRHWDITYQ